MPRLPANLEVLRLRDFRLLLAGQAVSIFGDRMVAVALAFAVLEVGGSPSEVGLVLAARTLPMVATVLIGGVVADRLSRRLVLIVADVTRVASQGLMAALLVAGAAEVWSLALLAIATGLATGFANPAATGMLPEIVPPEHLQPANALRATAFSASEIGGPVVAGLLVALAGAGWAIAVDAATFAVSAVFLVLLRVPPRGEREPSTFLADLRDGWTAFRSRRWVWSFVAYFALANMMWAAWAALGPIVADRELGGADAWGVVLGATGVGGLIGSALATRLDPHRPLVHVALMEGLFVLPLAFLALGSSVVLLAASAVVSGVGLMLGLSVWESTLQRRIPQESLSRVSSYDWFASFAFYPLGLALWGPVAEAIGISTTLWLAFGVLLASVVGLVATPDVRRLTRATG